MDRIKAHSTDECLATDCNEAWVLMLGTSDQHPDLPSQPPVEVPNWVRDSAWKGVELELSTPVEA